MTGIEALQEAARLEAARVYSLSVGEGSPELWHPPTNGGQVVNQYPPVAFMCSCGHSARLHNDDECRIESCPCVDFEVSP